MRSTALVALQRLAPRCVDGVAATALLQHGFAEYNGAGGKLTSSENKIAVLNVRNMYITYRIMDTACLLFVTLFRKYLKL